MGEYLCKGVENQYGWDLLNPPQSVIAAAYIQGAATIHAAELTERALDRLAVAITLFAGSVGGTS